MKKKCVSTILLGNHLNTFFSFLQTLTLIRIRPFLKKKTRMSGLLFLHLNDFQQQYFPNRGQLLCIQPEPRGMMLVMYYSKECDYCKHLFSQFKQLPSIVQGCQFAIFNVDLNPSIMELSLPTLCPIQYVPDVLLYVDGVPTIRYDGEHTVQSIQTFLQQMYQKLQKNTFVRAPSLSSSSSSSSSSPPSNSLPSGIESKGNQDFVDPRIQQFVHQQQQKTPESYLPQTPTYVEQTKQPHGNRFQQTPPPPPSSLYPNHSNHGSSSLPSSSSKPPTSSSPTIPSYTIGKPVCGSDNKCYLAFDNAYQNGNHTSRQDIPSVMNR